MGNTEICTRKTSVVLPDMKFDNLLEPCYNTDISKIVCCAS